MEARIVDKDDPPPPRTERPNPLKYTDGEFAKRDLTIREMEKAHPKIPFKWLEWLYDTIENKPKEEVEEIMRTNAWDKKLNTDRSNGGILPNACEVLPPSADLVEIKE